MAQVYDNGPNIRGKQRCSSAYVLGKPMRIVYVLRFPLSELRLCIGCKFPHIYSFTFLRLYKDGIFLKGSVPIHIVKKCFNTL
jgi:hypothetical protein